MKRFEAGGATLSKNNTATTKPSTKRPKAATAKKGVAAEMQAEDGEDEENEGGEEAEPPRKKAKQVEPQNGRGDGSWPHDSTGKAKAPAKARVGAKRGVAKKKAGVKLEKKIGEVAHGEEVDDGGDREDQDGEESF
jgi:hypothetical protein